MQNTDNVYERVWPPQIFALGLGPNSARALYSGVLLKYAVLIRPLRSNCIRACTNGNVPVQCKL
jgi:hypothetical protein